jgi:cephalosporin hydroxylase
VKTTRIGPLILALTAAGCSNRRPAEPVSEIAVAGDVNKDRILRGIYPGAEAWRWTAPVFAFRLDPPATPAPMYLEMDFAVPEELMQRASAVTVVAKVNGIEAVRQTYRQPGRYTLASRLSSSALARRPAEVEFQADCSFTASADSLPKSLIVISAGLKPYEQTAEFRDAEMRKSREAYEAILKQRDLQVPIDRQHEIMRLFHDLSIWNNLQFHNVRIIKNPLDLWMLQQIAWQVRPDFVVETGTFHGGSALWWAQTLNGMGLEHARVLTVDIQDLTKTAATHPLWKKHIDFYLGSSTDPRIVSRIAQRVRNARVIVNLDSDHSMAHVLRELRLYAPMVSAASYIVVEDTHLDGVPTHPEQGAGPTAAVRQFLSIEDGRAFEQDFTREAFVMTSYPGGWLRRKSQVSAQKTDQSRPAPLKLVNR